MVGPAFPVELERDIFETAALSHPSTMAALVRVSRRVFIWITPLLYRVAILDMIPPHPGMLPALLRAANRTPLPTVFPYVRHFLAGSGQLLDKERDVRDLLQLCTGVVDLAAPYALRPTMLPILGALRLQRLSISLFSLFGQDYDGGRSRIDFSPSLFASITHLSLFDSIHAASSIPAYRLSAWFPALTHLCFLHSTPLELVRYLLVACSDLQVLVVRLINADVASKWAQDLVADKRLVAAQIASWSAEWVAAAYDQPNLWSHVEDFVTRRHRGAVIPDSCWLEHEEASSRWE
ncbi:hypothetical protein C8F04DRAFT_1143018 [Mycena alexandri]|uniref:Uncharacterized protein n=1 Tax=Mycena alexandri TaxID=1745969 RepID=A0AAD6WTT9_9AGAR|nr:hypothetical protein C8F04DRAFT_1143018 [Mycena alexandri]